MPGPKSRKATERLAAAGLRLSEVRNATTLAETLVQAVAELSGAERVLVVLDEPDGVSVAASHLPPDEDAGALLDAVTPWLAEARRTRAARLRHGPDGHPAIDQRSC